MYSTVTNLYKIHPSFTSAVRIWTLLTLNELNKNKRVLLLIKVDLHILPRNWFIRVALLQLLFTKFYKYWPLLTSNDLWVQTITIAFLYSMFEVRPRCTFWVTLFHADVTYIQIYTDTHINTHARTTHNYIRYMPLPFLIFFCLSKELT